MRARGRLRAGLALGAAFLLGALAGGFGATSRQLRGFAMRMHGPDARARAAFRLEAMARELDLSSQQRDAVQQIFERHEDERRRAFERCEPEHRALREKIEVELRAVLTPEQQAKHDELRRARHEAPPAPPPPTQ